MRNTRKASRRRSLAVVGAAAAVSLAFTAGCSSSDSSASSSSSNAGSSSSSSGPFKIAVPADLSGGDAGFAGILTAGIKAAAAYVNEHGGINGQQIKLTIADMQSNPSGGVTVAQNMLATGGYKALVPGAGSYNGIGVNLAELATRLKILETNVGGDPTLGDPAKFPYSFSTNISSDAEGNAFACFLKQVYAPKTVALLHTNDSFTDAEFSQLAAHGMQVIDNYEVAPTTSDFTAAIQAIKSKKPNVFVAELLGAQLGQFLNNLKAVGYTGDMAGGLDVSAVDPATYLPHGDLSLIPPNYAVMAPTGASNDNGTLTSLQQALLKSIGKPEGPLSDYAFGWDQIILVKYAYEHAKSDSITDLVNALQSLNGSKDIGTIGVAAPSFSSTSHAYADFDYSQVAFNKPTLDGTWSSVRKISASC
jgi:ABC-type branched-subunit amino acid transport system substrate-binding protein